MSGDLLSKYTSQEQLELVLKEFAGWKSSIEKKIAAMKRDYPRETLSRLGYDEAEAEFAVRIEEARCNAYVNSATRYSVTACYYGKRRHLLQFTMGNYPYCCGYQMLFGFTYAEQISPEVFNTLMDILFTRHIHNSRLQYCRRIEMVMVGNDLTTLQYQRYYDWFKLVAVEISVRADHNYNSGNLLQNLSIELPRGFVKG